jgi:hypothetical protein
MLKIIFRSAVYCPKCICIISYFLGDFDEESDEMAERDWNEYWRMLFKPITVKDITDYEKKYKGKACKIV